MRSCIFFLDINLSLDLNRSRKIRRIMRHVPGDALMRFLCHHIALTCSETWLHGSSRFPHSRTITRRASPTVDTPHHSQFARTRRTENVDGPCHFFAEHFFLSFSGVRSLSHTFRCDSCAILSTRLLRCQTETRFRISFVTCVPDFGRPLLNSPGQPSVATFLPIRDGQLCRVQSICQPEV